MKIKLTDIELAAIIAEGNAEKGIIELLIEENKIIFNDILEDEVLMTRKGKNFAENYLSKDFTGIQLGIIRILDSKNERFLLPKEHKDIPIFNILTRPEIEMLLLISIDKDENYKQKGHRDNIHSYLGNYLSGNIKSEKFIKNHFQNITHLIDCIEKYHNKYHNYSDGNSLYDIIKK